MTLKSITVNLRINQSPTHFTCTVRLSKKKNRGRDHKTKVKHNYTRENIRREIHEFALLAEGKEV